MQTLILSILCLLPISVLAQAEWTLIGTDPDPVNAFVVDSCGRYLTSTGYEIYTSEDQGNTWSPFESVTNPFDEVAPTASGYESASSLPDLTFPQAITQNITPTLIS